MTQIIMYTDGSCKGNPGPGGWAVVFPHPDGYRVRRSLRGRTLQTTSNRMELTAAIRGLENLGGDVPIRIISDSTYLVNTINQGWKRRYNQDLWRKLDMLLLDHDVTFEWVKGHDGDHFNEEADKIAQAEAEKWRSITT